MEPATYRRSGGVLVVTGSLHLPVDAQFDISMRDLLEYADKEGACDLAIDLTGVTYMASQFLGAVGAVAITLQERGGSLTVRAGRRVAGLFKLSGFDHVMNLVVAD
jgi:anti-anti-sigma factor